MLSIKEINFYTSLVNKNLVSPIMCPTSQISEKHFTMSQVDDDLNVYFKCLDCNTKFTLGLNTENNIKEIIDKFKNIV